MYLLPFIHLFPTLLNNGFRVDVLHPIYRRFTMDEKHLGYLDLKEDISFKRYFSINKQVLFSLIKSFLPTPDNAPDMMILNPGILNPASETANQQNQSGDKLHLQDSSIPPDTPGGKQVVLDLHVKLHSGENIDIEMQGYSQKDFFSRMLVTLSCFYYHL